MLDAAFIVARLGRALYGADWARALAREVGLNERTAQRLRAAAEAGAPYPFSPGAMADLIALAEHRRGELESLIDQAEAWARDFQAARTKA